MDLISTAFLFTTLKMKEGMDIIMLSSSVKHDFWGFKTAIEPLIVMCKEVWILVYVFESNVHYFMMIVTTNTPFSLITLHLVMIKIIA